MEPTISAAAVNSRPPAPPFDAAEFDRINAALWDAARADPGRGEPLLEIAVGVLGSIALPGGSREWTQTEAAQALRRMLQRVLLGSTHKDTEDHR